MRILHNAIGFTFSNLQVQFQAGHGHKHPFLVIEQGEHKIHTKAGKITIQRHLSITESVDFNKRLHAEKLHGELATWEGEYTLQVETRPDHTAGTPFRITAHEHHHIAPGTRRRPAAKWSVAYDRMVIQLPAGYRLGLLPL